MPSVQVNNLGQRDVPVSISFLVPIALKGEAVWTVKAPQLQVLKTSRGSSAKALDFYSCVTHRSLVLQPKLCPLLAF